MPLFSPIWYQPKKCRHPAAFQSIDKADAPPSKVSKQTFDGSIHLL